MRDQLAEPRMQLRERREEQSVPRHRLIDARRHQDHEIQEAERRLDGILAGLRKTIPGDEVARRVRESLRR